MHDGIDEAFQRVLQQTHSDSGRLRKGGLQTPRHSRGSLPASIGEHGAIGLFAGQRPTPMTHTGMNEREGHE